MKNFGSGGDNIRPNYCYLLDIGKLQPGDIILTAAPGELVSELIRFVTSSEFSHAILVADRPYAVESSDYGVVKFRLDRFAVCERKNVKVLRVKKEIRDDTNLDIAVKHALKQVTKKYATIDVYFSKLNSAPRFQSGKYFCSQLVAEAYQKCGINIVPSGRSKNVTPATLEKSEIFEVVDCLVCHETVSLSIIPAYLDSSNQRSPAEEEGILRQKVVDSVKNGFKKQGRVIHDFYGGLTVLCELWGENASCCVELDKEFSEAIVSSGLLEATAKLFPAHSDMLFMDFYIRNAIVSGEFRMEKQKRLLVSLHKEYKRMSLTFTERDEDVTVLKKMYLDSGLETIRLHLACCWEALWLSSRLKSVYERAINILEMSLKTAAS